MALYWPEEKVALDIVDDPMRRPFEGDESYTVLRVTCADLCDYDSYRKIMGRLCELLGREIPSMPGWEDKNRALFELLGSDVFANYMNAVMSDPDACTDDDLDALYSSLGYTPTDEELANVQIVASSQEEADRMRADARREGRYVRGISVWEGPVPK